MSSLKLVIVPQTGDATDLFRPPETITYESLGGFEPYCRNSPQPSILGTFAM